MTFTLTVESDNYLFDDSLGPCEIELQTILQAVANDIWDEDHALIRDSNGNTVGEWRLTR